MKSILGVCCLAGLLALAPGTAQAQGRRYGVVQSPFGPLYDTRSPEWRMAGGDMMLYEQIMEQRMMLQQQQMLMKQQQMMLRQQKNAKKGTQPAASLNADDANGFGRNNQAGNPLPHRAKKKQRGAVAAHASKSTAKRSAVKPSAATKTQKTSSSVAKPSTAQPSNDASIIPQ
jgi:hypothetical protein